MMKGGGGERRRKKRGEKKKKEKKRGGKKKTQKKEKEERKKKEERGNRKYKTKKDLVSEQNCILFIFLIVDRNERGKKIKNKLTNNFTNFIKNVTNIINDSFDKRPQFCNTV